MRFIGTKTHAFLDYLSAIALIASPWLFGFAAQNTPSMLTILFGGMILTMSIFTAYEGGIVRIISMWAHLAVDVTMGAILVAIPWIFDFKENVYLPFLVVGALTLATGFTTKGGPPQKNAS